MSDKNANVTTVASGREKEPTCESVPPYILGSLVSADDLPTTGETPDGDTLTGGEAYIIGADIHVWQADKQYWQILELIPPEVVGYRDLTTKELTKLLVKKGLATQLKEYLATSPVCDVRKFAEAYGIDTQISIIDDAHEDTTMTHTPNQPIREEHQYLNLLRRVLDEGTFKGDRTGVGCYSVRGGMMRFDLTDGKIPLLTTKKMGIKSIIAELLWFLEGSTDNNRLNELGATIWNEWATEDGDLGPIYGKQWTAWEAPNKRVLNRLIADVENNRPGSLAKLKEVINNPPTINQIDELVKTLKENPNSRRMLVSAWNPAVLPHDYYWEHALLYVEEYHHALGNGWEVMDTQTRLTWMKDMDWCYSKMMDIDHIDTLGVPNVRRRLKLSPQDNVKCGRASLPACHTMFQVHTRELMTHERMEWLRINNVHAWKPIINHPLKLYSNDDRLDDLDVPKHALTLQFFARSQDVPLGTPYNIASYGILAQMLAHCTGMIAEELIYMAGDIHIYQGQEEGVREQLTREPKDWPTLQLNPNVKDIFSFTTEDFKLSEYDPHPKIDFGPVAV